MLNQIVMLFALKNTVFTVISCIIQNSVVTVWYYHMPFFSDVEKKVNDGGGNGDFFEKVRILTFLGSNIF